MRTLCTVILLIIHSLAFGQKELNKNNLQFLHTSGQDIVNESGDKIFLKGVGLGNWLLPEGYMWKFGALGDRPRKIEKLISDLVGPAKAAAFWKAFRQNYITEADIKRIAELGFNSVRPALNAKLFLSEGENPVYLDEGFQLMDSLVGWCKKHKLYVIIDMHGAPGGQTGANIDDSANDLPELFMEKKFEDQLVDLWIKIVQRYKDEPTVAAYDLLNEPLPVGTGSAEKYKHLLIPIYQRLTSEIRKIDQRHMITLEGYDWAGNWSLFDKPFDSNTFYQFHFYCWNRPDHFNSIDQYLAKRKELNTPIWVGETGEKNNTLYWTTSQYFIKQNIGFSFWPWKKMDTWNTPYSIKKPSHWDEIAKYSDGGTKPESTVAETVLNELIENIKLANCVYFEDVCNSILTRVPGKIEAENYGHDGYNHSYFVQDTTTKSKFYRTKEPVPVEVEGDQKELSSKQFIQLKKSEWVAYHFESLENKKYTMKMRASSMAPSKISILINGQPVNFKVSNKNLTEAMVGNYLLKKGSNVVKVKAESNAVAIDWISFN